MVQINYLPSAIAVSDSLFKLCCGWSGWSHLHSCIAKGPNHMVVVYAAFQTQLSRKFSFRTTGALVSCYKLKQKHVPDHFLLQYDLILNSALSFSFLCCSFVWACRSCNVAAHTAAKLALSRQLHLYVSVRRINLRLSSLLVSQTPPMQFLLFSIYVE